MFLMPSKFEPCGLNQLYSLRYGTIPIVRATRRACPTRWLTGPRTAAPDFFLRVLVRRDDDRDPEGTGGLFDPMRWRALIRRMSQDWSWNRSVLSVHAAL